ncbi:Na+/H+ antiporter NhaA [Marinobacterium rhizophilum]|uniref:Na+/H+ antiporter NhaA n=1 Tax=Marinobacterium rhizophilum TaxID=420402 RepID=UPI0023E45C8A|nr:Na+/H+ antiporter NhaA [Marinobacterium rhizophilum]
MQPFQKFVATEVSGGLLLLAAATLALVLANTGLGQWMERFWTTEAGLLVADRQLLLSLRHWINDGLLTIFFFVVGLEIKRELTDGELNTPAAAALPFAAALGGMAVPAVVYLVLVPGAEAAKGWGIVMATDIAFVVGCLALLGSRVPAALRVFLLALAIIDDIGAVVVIAVGYSQGFDGQMFLAAVIGLVIVFCMQYLGVRTVIAYWLAGILIWAAMYASGLHPTLTGVALGLMTPTGPWVSPLRLQRFIDWSSPFVARAQRRGDREAPKAVGQRLKKAARESVPPQQRLEDAVHPWSAFLILPLFALANAGTPLPATLNLDPVSLAVTAGLAVGKPLGIVSFAWIAVRLGLANKPAEVSWTMLLGAGMLSGIGFTMSIFIGELAFDGALLADAKLGVILASLLSGAVGLAWLWVVLPKSTQAS